jgi:hypothetical protein
VTGAGQVVRNDVPAQRLVLAPPPRLDVELRPGRLDEAATRREKNVAYIAQLIALRTWYRQVRLGRLPVSSEEHDAAWVQRTVISAALETLNLCIEERVARLEGFLGERGEPMVPLRLDEPALDCPIALESASDPSDHVDWVRRASERDVAQLQAWLEAVCAGVRG